MFLLQGVHQLVWTLEYALRDSLKLENAEGVEEAF